MGVEAFARALDGGADVVIAGRACDTAVFAAVPQMLGYPMALSMHMAKIIECTSICCTPGGRDTIVGYLESESFVLESMNPERHATPTSVAAHSLYEQADPFSVAEPEGVLRLEGARYEALDAHRTRVYGARWEDAACPRVKIEGAFLEGQRAVLLAGSVDPQVIDRIDEILTAVEATTRNLFAHSFRIFPRVYGRQGVTSLAAGRRGEAPSTKSFSSSNAWLRTTIRLSERLPCSNNICCIMDSLVGFRLAATSPSRSRRRN